MPHPEPPQPAAAPRRFRWRRLVQYRLRTLLILTAMAAAHFAWWSYKVRQQREAIAELAAESTVLISYNKALPLTGWMREPMEWPEWVWEWIDADYIARPIEANFLFEAFFTQDELDHLQNSLPNCKLTGRIWILSAPTERNNSPPPPAPLSLAAACGVTSDDKQHFFIAPTCVVAMSSAFISLAANRV